MLHLAMKAFYPSPKPPFPLLHVDTTWKFREMIEFRDRKAAEMGMDLIVHTNEEGVREGINPFSSRLRRAHRCHEDEALKQALDKYKFDAAFGGARRDEEKSRAKERIFSFRSADHRWDPKTSARNSGALQHPHQAGREHPRLPAVQLDRARHLAIHPSAKHRDRAALLRRRTPGGERDG
jgi:3'-phosphoadenosine 5'-phosphosulfate sulfotransferase (PAPS reductase)/FAD synthetase